MKVGDLMDVLDGVDADCEVRLAFQPNYPLEYEVGQVVVVENHEFIKGTNDDEDDPSCKLCGESEDDHSETDEGTVVYIGEGGQTWRAYLPGAVSAEFGWR